MLQGRFLLKCSSQLLKVLSMPCYSLNGVTPVVEPGAFVHPTAVLIGSVHVEANCYVGPGASLRGDFGRIHLRAGSNVQDNCVLHGFPEQPTVVEECGHIGHGAILHGCTVRRGALVGMNAVIMDEADIGEEAFVGACAFVPAGMHISPRVLVVGTPAKTVRPLADDEVMWKHRGTLNYQELAVESLASMKEVPPLTSAPAKMGSTKISSAEGQSLIATRRKQAA